MKFDFSIERVELNHLIELQQISRQTFEESFAAYNRDEDMRDYLENKLSLEQLLFEIQSHGSEFYFIYHKCDLAGYLKINHCSIQTDSKGYEGLEIERIYISKNFQGQHLGQKLLDIARERAIALDCNQVWLGVWEHNHRAISFYEKNGFIPFGSQIFMLGLDRQTDILMRLNLL